MFFEAINRVMVATGHIMKGGTVVDATIINAPSSTKNAEKARGPEMHHTKKGNQYYFGMKCHAGVDAGTGLVHSIEVTAANMHDVTMAAQLVREDDEVVYGDSAYLGIEKRPEVMGDEHLSGVFPHQPPAQQPAQSIRQRARLGASDRGRKSSVRSRVEHIFRIIKCQFGYTKTRYRGLMKNANRLYAMFGCANLYLLARAGKKLRMA